MIRITNHLGTAAAAHGDVHGSTLAGQHRSRAHGGAMLFTGGIALALAAALVVIDIPLPIVTAPPAAATSSATVRPVVPPPVAQLLHSRWQTQSRDPDIAVGEIADITVQFRNVGETSWIRGTAAEVRLGEVGDRRLPTAMRVDWPYWDRPAIQAEPFVGEQSLATFSFQVKGVAPGLFRVRLRPVVDGVAWLEDEGVYVDIRVRSDSDLAP